MKKKFLLISLSVCVLAASIIGCGSTGGTEPDTTTQETEAGDTADTSDQETEVSEDLSADAASAKEMIDTLAINTDAFQPTVQKYLSTVSQSHWQDLCLTIFQKKISRLWMLMEL